MYITRRLQCDGETRSCGQARAEIILHVRQAILQYSPACYILGRGKCAAAPAHSRVEELPAPARRIVSCSLLPGLCVSDQLPADQALPAAEACMACHTQAPPGKVHGNAWRHRMACRARAGPCWHAWLKCIWHHSMTSLVKCMASQHDLLGEVHMASQHDLLGEVHGTADPRHRTACRVRAGIPSPLPNCLTLLHSITHIWHQRVACCACVCVCVCRPPLDWQAAGPNEWNFSYSMQGKSHGFKLVVALHDKTGRWSRCMSGWGRCALPCSSPALERACPA